MTGRRRVPPGCEQEIIGRYSGGQSLRQAGQPHGAGHGAVTAILRRHGIAVRPRGRPRLRTPAAAPSAAVGGDRLLNVSTVTVYRRIRAGELDAIRFSPRGTWVRESVIRAYPASRRVGPPGPAGGTAAGVQAGGPPPATAARPAAPPLGEGVPWLRAGGVVVPLPGEVTTVGGGGCGIWLDDPSVSVLHTGLVRRGRYVCVASLGPPGGAVMVNGWPVTRRVLADGDVVTFGQVACTVGGIPAGIASPPAPVPAVSRRQRDVVAALCEPARSGQPFAAPAQIAAALGISQGAVKRRLARLYRQFGVPAGPGRRVRFANLAVTLGLAQSAGCARRLAS